MVEERIIEAVQDLPCLWKPTETTYKDLRVKENAWKEVALKVSSKIELILSSHYFLFCNKTLKAPSWYFACIEWFDSRRMSKKVEVTKGQIYQRIKKG